MEMFDIEQSPFREDFDTSLFFPGAGRSELLGKLKSAINESVALLTLTGEEGCGKSMMCKMIEKEVPNGYILVHFSETFDSFEDVTRLIAQKMKITLADGVAVSDIRDLLLEVWERLAEKNQRMLLIFDQAERIHLATLERIRKMLDIVNQTGIAFQILFAGRPGLLKNLKNLSLCNFQGAMERHFSLELLDSSETHSYLNFCMNRGTNEGKEIFSPEMSEKVFMIADGNIRMTNILAEESLPLFTTDPSFMVLLDNVQDTVQETSPKGKSGGWDYSIFKEAFLANKKWTIPLSAGLGVLLLLLILRMGEIPDVQDNKLAPKVETPSAEVQNIQKEPEEMKVEAVTTDMDEPHGAEREKAEGEKTPAAITSATEEVVPEKKQVVEKHVEPKHPLLSNTPSSNTPLVNAKPKNSAPEKIHISKNPLILKKTFIPEKSSIAQKLPVEKVFTGRVAASAKWVIGEKNDHFTIQLMVLGAEGAEKKLKKMLAQNQYQEVANRLFILRRAASPPIVLVFYGEYPTMNDARKAQKALPSFLLKNNPYAISVRGAVKKANGG
jgi:type II secretory pathway predicted ATPase ExeA/septal ring-binding cell division protein DamX